ncbi:MAG: polyprenyl synthetase family protein [Candidatus Moraniibacteriota bacterium]
MNIKEELKNFRDRVDPELEFFFDRIIADSKKNNFITTDALKQVKKITLSGGKRLRPALMYWGYRGVGGESEKEIIKTSISIELIHIFLLIHDDIIDNDKTRHGEKTIHTLYDQKGKKLCHGERDSRHFGNSIAIVVGDIIGALGNRVLFQSNFPPELVIQALSRLQDIVARVAVGEAQDVFIEHRRRSTEPEVLDMYKNKTAKYTIEGPLHLGAILAGADEKVLRAISKFSVPIGIAFQIQDDILGVFGNERKIGKPVGSDIREGKQTLLVVRALEKGTGEQKKIIRKLLGKKNITLKEIELFKKVIRETSALEYSQDLARKLIGEGKEALKGLSFKKEAKDFLSGVADYMMEREI